MSSADRQREAEREFELLRKELAPVIADEERRVWDAIASEVDEHSRILARSQALAGRRVYRAASTNDPLVVWLRNPLADIIGDNDFPGRNADRLRRTIERQKRVARRSPR